MVRHAAHTEIDSAPAISTVRGKPFQRTLTDKASSVFLFACAIWGAPHTIIVSK